MTTLYVMVGLPGSGKSTFIKNHFFENKNVVHLSRDNIRFSMVSKDEPYFSKENQVKKEYIQMINDYLAVGYDIIADATQINEGTRQSLLSKINGYNHLVAIFINTPLETCIQRNATREGRLRVLESSIIDMASRLQAPTLDEGFDEVWEINQR